ncbi:Gti1/Pac2 family-domain-containing protein [Phaeosphaeriaceae sp. PMI808]|nr:Gti1/Pac2 family-domain-containing protein [Phaeosphaeriaceae sp. PMI808]
METYHGHVRTPNDAIILFEACRIGILPRVQRRLSEKERQQIKSGSVFVWDEREAGMRRWTDGKSWSASRVSGSFLTYREMEGKRGGSALPLPTAPVVKRPSGKSPDGSATGDSDGEGPDGYRYKADGLMKQSFSITTSSGQHLHLISYYSRSNSTNLPQPTNDPQLRHIRPPKNMYPESTVSEAQAVPAVTRGPMPGSPYSAASHSMPPTSPYARPGPASAPPMYAVPVYPPTPPNGTPPLHPYYAQHPYFYGGIIYTQPPYHPQGHVFDRPPPQISNPHAPPGHPAHPGHPMLTHHPAYVTHAAHAAQQYIATPPARAPSTAEQAQHHPAQAHPPPPPPASLPEQGPQLPAINGASVSVNKPPTPEPSDKVQSQVNESNGTTSSRPLPTLGSLLNGDGPEKENQSNSRSGSRSPNTVQRFPRDLAPERLAKNSSAADSSALNKLNSVFVRS